MKRIKFLGLTLALAGLVFAGCDTVGDPQILDSNFVYLSEPSAVDGLAYEKVMLSSATEVDVKFNVLLVDYAAKDITVTLDVENATLISAYNTAEFRSFEVIPQANLAFKGTGVTQSADGKSITVTVPTGSNMVEVTATVTRFFEMTVGKEYAVAVKLTSVADTEGVLMAPENYGTLILPVSLLDELGDEVEIPGIPIPVGKYPLIKYVRDDKNFAVQAVHWAAIFEGDYTVEGWVNVSSWGGMESNVQFMDNRKFNNDMTGGTGQPIDEFFVRFGNKVSGGKSSLEVKANGGTANDTSPLDIKWPSGEWFHLCIVYRARYNELIAYKNGEQIFKLDGYPTPIYNGGRTRFEHVGMVGTHGGGISSSETMGLREVRIWKTARRAAQINNYMRLRIDPADPNLVAQWTFEDTGVATPATFANSAAWDGTQNRGRNEIPKAPEMKVYASSYIGGWGASVDFSTVQVTLEDGSKVPAN